MNIYQINSHVAGVLTQKTVVIVSTVITPEDAHFITNPLAKCQMTMPAVTETFIECLVPN